MISLRYTTRYATLLFAMSAMPFSHTQNNPIPMPNLLSRNRKHVQFLLGPYRASLSRA